MTSLYPGNNHFVQVVLTDEDGVAVSAATATWVMTRLDGTAVDSGTIPNVTANTYKGTIPDTQWGALALETTLYLTVSAVEAGRKGRWKEVCVVKDRDAASTC